MDQFMISPLGGGELQWYSVTNQTVWLAIAVVATFFLLVVGARGRALVPSRSQSVAEMIYGFVRNMVEEVASKEALKYFPHILTIFMFILLSNVLGLIPYSFTATSHIAITGVLALAVFLGVTILGFARNGLGFFKLLWVSSAPTVALRMVLFLIELISYFVRPVSHSIRLAGNMMAGHAVIKVFAGFAGALGVGAVAPIVAITAVYGLEILVAAIQAYVFTILTCVYLHDALHPGH
ncbi:MAG TPA: F0F1 ATP synthase subunit A [Paracoccaceae bacterium]|nr:F0F1 ATP synthase subunit A [Paracoccaceae bacterium]